MGIDYLFEGVKLKNVTVGRKKRKRKPGAGSAQSIRGHTRTPRGPNRGKRKVRVDGYRRSKPKRKRKSRRR